MTFPDYCPILRPGRHAPAPGRPTTGAAARAGGPVRCAVAAWLGLLLAGTATAGDLEVRVVERDSGDPVADAAVCVGTRADPAQMGAHRTPDDGRVRFEGLPRAPLVLTVSRDGYRGQRRELEPFETSHVAQVRLASGGLGPRCADAQSSSGAGGAGALHVKDVRAAAVADEPGVVTLRHDIDGEGTHFRVGTDRDLDEAPWRPLEQAPRVEVGEPVRGRTLYFQVRRYQQRDGASLEVRSPVVSTTVAGQEEE